MSQQAHRYVGFFVILFDIITNNNNQGEMTMKQKIADVFVNFTHEWNSALHESIERKIREGYDKSFPHANDIEHRISTEKTIREFYYQRMMNTASLLLTGVSLLVALVALFVAIMAIKYS
ncbi:hypothetical protein AB9Q07_15990 [Klebsiella quasipneumoniae]|uniref:hypothetical protein n=2 Tax=Klebsiella TaxID=570 RepID=UPI00351F6EE2